MGRNKCLELLETRTRRLLDLVESAAPTHLICNEVSLIIRATRNISPAFLEEHSERAEIQCIATG